MTKTQAAVGVGIIGSSINSPSRQKNSLKLKNNHRNKRKAFSVAEAVIALLIGSVALGMAAPMITKQIKQNNFTDTELSVLRRQGVPVGAIMFFNAPRCPDGWDPLVNSEGEEYDGFYPRIGSEGSSEIGTTKEQMVHKHKHVSPFMINWSSNNVGNSYRYGPYRNLGSSARPIVGDGQYPAPQITANGSAYNVSASTLLFNNGGFSAGTTNNWYLYTSDGMNRNESLEIASNDIVENVLTCPNRDEGDSICNPTNNSFSYESLGRNMNATIPYLEEMPLVGDENRPNSIVLLACQRGN